MKKVKVTYEAIVDDSKIKTKDDLLAEGYEDLEEAILTDGLDGAINGSFNFSINWEVSDVEE